MSKLKPSSFCHSTTVINYQTSIGRTSKLKRKEIGFVSPLVRQTHERTYWHKKWMITLQNWKFHPKIN